MPQIPILGGLFGSRDDTFEGSVISCGAPTDVFQPEVLRISPDPPRRGQPINVEVVGTLSEDVTDGSYINVKAKLGVIKLVDQKMDLCKEIQQINRTCPVQKGHQVVTHTADIPREVPPGKYTITVRAFTANDAPLACLDIIFRM